MNKDNVWRIVKRGKKLFKVRYWDNLSYKQYRIVTPYISFCGIPLFEKNKENYLKKVIDAGLKDYVIGVEL
ncbi:MAG: hypothetical protein KKB31_01640 [Nanoarchaeota archaeon]|nr:hypothetical protein [Nanoarchaeota archaeon]